MTTVLFVDDNRNIREYCRRELEEEGYCVLVAGDGAEAVSLAERLLPDVVVLDICMPRVDGLEAAARIRASHVDIPLILFTSYDDACVEDDKSRFATACVEKNEDLTELKHVIVSALRAQRQGVPYQVGLPPRALDSTASAMQV